MKMVKDVILTYAEHVAALCVGRELREKAGVPYSGAAELTQAPCTGKTQPALPEAVAEKLIYGKRLCDEFRKSGGQVHCQVWQVWQVGWAGALPRRL